MPESLGYHYLVCCLNAIYHPTEIDIHHLIPIFDTEMADVAADSDSCIVEDIVQATCALNGFLNEPFHSSKIGDIDIQSPGFSA